MVRKPGNLVGALVMAGFGVLWWVVGSNGLGDWADPLRTAGLVFGVALMLIAGWRVRRVPADPPGLPERGEKRFDWIIFTEAAVIAIVVILGNAFGVFPIVPPLIALVAGLYFFPLGRLFHQAEYHVVGVLMVLIAVVSFIAVPWLGKAAPFVLPGLASAILLWGACIVSLLTSHPVRMSAHKVV